MYVFAQTSHEYEGISTKFFLELIYNVKDFFPKINVKRNVSMMMTRSKPASPHLPKVCLHEYVLIFIASRRY